MFSGRKIASGRGCGLVVGLGLCLCASVASGGGPPWRFMSASSNTQDWQYSESGVFGPNPLDVLVDDGGGMAQWGDDGWQPADLGLVTSWVTSVQGGNVDWQSALPGDRSWAADVAGRVPLPEPPIVAMVTVAGGLAAYGRKLGEYVAIVVLAIVGFLVCRRSLSWSRKF